MWLISLAACGPRPEFVTAPSISTTPNAPLSAELTVTSDIPTILHVTLKSDNVDLDLTFPDLTCEHRVQLHATRPDQEIEVHIELDDPLGGHRSENASWHTDPLPADLPRIELLGVDASRVYEGWLLLPIVSIDGGGWLVAIDPRDGEIVWAYAGPWRLEVVGLSDHKTLVGLSGQGVVEIDWMGNELHRWETPDSPPAGGIPIQASRIDHDVQLKDGQLTLISTRAAHVKEFPTSYEDPTLLGGPATLEDHEIVTFDAEDGTDDALPLRMTAGASTPL